MEEVFGNLILLEDYSFGSGENLLGDNIIAPIAWGGTFHGLSCFGTSILTPLMLGVWLGVDLLGALRQGCGCL